jgi:uncharacterized membrane protein YfcA
MLLIAGLLSLFVGLSLGLLGGGGSILTLPILLYVVGLPAKEAIATSLLVVGCASFMAMANHARKGRVSLKVALSFGPASMLTSYCAGRFAHLLSSAWLLSLFGVVMLVTGAAMLRRRPCQGSSVCYVKALLAGAGVGCITGLVGAGGGFLIVPALTMFAGVAIPCAVGTSLLLITLNSLSGLLGYLGHAELHASLALFVTLGAVLGSVVGSALSERLSPESLRRAFALLVLPTGAVILFKQLPPEAWRSLLGDPRATHALALLTGACTWALTLRVRAYYLRTRAKPIPAT